VDEFTTLYRQYAPDVFRFALHLSRDRHEAEDITSETFVRAWTSPEPIRLATVKGYLFTIARNLFLQRLRKRLRHVELKDELRDPGPDPLARVEQSSQVRVVLDGVRKLPEIDRSALLMRALDGMAYAEIGRALGITLASVKVKIHRARLALLALKDV
jgi:RNA polymerase sigma-70 factor (ECF subfamily)